MGKPKFTVSIKEQRRAHASMFKRLNAGKIPRVTIVQEKPEAGGKVLVVASNYEKAAEQLAKLGLTDTAWDIADHMIQR